MSNNLGDQIRIFGDALEAGDAVRIQGLLSLSPGLVNSPVPPTGEYPLYLSAKRNQLSIVDLLIGLGADVNAKSYRGSTALHGAAVENSDLAAAALLAAGADPEVANERKERPVHVAAEFGSSRSLIQLARAGVDLNSRGPYNWTPLHYAARFGHPDAASVLLDFGADPDLTNDDDHTPLFLAPQHSLQPKSSALIGLLLQAGATVDIHVAILLKMTNIVRCLLRCDHELVAKHPNANDFVSTAILAGSPEIVQLLLEHGANPNSFRYETLPLLAAMISYSADETAVANMVQLLIKHGALPTAIDPRDGRTPIKWASEHNPNLLKLFATNADA